MSFHHVAAKGRELDPRLSPWPRSAACRMSGRCFRLFSAGPDNMSRRPRICRMTFSLSLIASLPRTSERLGVSSPSLRRTGLPLADPSENRGVKLRRVLSGEHQRRERAEALQDAVEGRFIGPVRAGWPRHGRAKSMGRPVRGTVKAYWWGAASLRESAIV